MHSPNTHAHTGILRFVCDSRTCNGRTHASKRDDRMWCESTAESFYSDSCTRNTCEQHADVCALSVCARVYLSIDRQTHKFASAAKRERFKTCTSHIYCEWYVRMRLSVCMKPRRVNGRSSDLILDCVFFFWFSSIYYDRILARLLTQPYARTHSHTYTVRRVERARCCRVCLVSLLLFACWFVVLYFVSSVSGYACRSHVYTYVISSNHAGFARCVLYVVLCAVCVFLEISRNRWMHETNVV